MNQPNIAFGKGFINSSKIKSHEAPVYNLNPSNGMPKPIKATPKASAAKGGRKK